MGGVFQKHSARFAIGFSQPANLDFIDCLRDIFKNALTLGFCFSRLRR